MSIAYISYNCPNCMRFIESLDRIPSLRGQVKLVDVSDVSQLPPNHSITAVPTLVVHGKAMVGKEAFDYLAQFNNEVELESVSLGTGTLAFGDFSAV